MQNIESKVVSMKPSILEPDDNKSDDNDNLILQGMIMSDEFLSSLKQIPFLYRLFKSRHSKIVAGYCLEYYQKYGVAPKSTITEIFNEKSKLLEKDATKTLVKHLLEYTQKRWCAGGCEFDLLYHFERAEKILNWRIMELVQEEEEDPKQGLTKYPFVSLTDGEIKTSFDDALSGTEPLVMTFADFKKIEKKPKECHMHGAFPLEKATITLVTGDPGAGKTWFLGEIGRVISSGSYGLGGIVHATEPQKVLIVDGELPLRELEDRSNALGLDEIPHIKVLSKSLFQKMDVKPELNLNDPTIREKLGKYLEDDQYELVILDNIFSLFPGLDMDSSKEWNPINDWLLALRSKGISVIIAHHPNKSGKQFGTHSKTWNIDNALMLNKSTPEDKIVDNTCCFTIKIDKQRGTGIRIGGKKFVFRDNQWNVEGLSKVEAKADKEKYILEGLAQGLQQDVIAQKVAEQGIPCNQSDVSKAKARFINADILTEDGKLTVVGQRKLISDQQIL